MKYWTTLSLFAVLLAAGTTAAHPVTHVDEAGVSLPEAEETLFDQQNGLAHGSAPFDAKFQTLSLTQADQPQLLQDVENLTRVPNGSRVRFQGTIGGRPFHVDMKTHKGDLDIKMKGIQFASQEQASSFMSALEQGGADRIKLNGTIDGRPFHASFQDQKGHVKEQFAFSAPKPHDAGVVHQPKTRTMTSVVQPKHETVITTASGRTFTAGITTGSMSSASAGGDHGVKGGSHDGGAHDAGVHDAGAHDGGAKVVKPGK